MIDQTPQHPEAIRDGVADAFVYHLANNPALLEAVQEGVRQAMHDHLTKESHA